jgi:CheY-like chemotaxis protein
MSKDSATALQTQINDVVRIVQNSSAIASESEDWRRRILWVDDRPDNNRYERKAFEAMGLEFVLSETTDDALTQLKSQRFASVISNMGRREGPREGYVLLDALRTFDKTTPLFFTLPRMRESIRKRRRGTGGKAAPTMHRNFFGW